VILGLQLSILIAGTGKQRAAPDLWQSTGIKSFVDARGRPHVRSDRTDEGASGGSHCAASRSVAVESALNDAIRLHRAGHLGDAEQIYRRILDAQPNHCDSLHLLGAIDLQRSNYAEAVRKIDAALELDPTLSEAFNNRGTALQQMNRLDEAVASHDRAILLKADYAEAFNNRGNALLELRRLDEALASHDRAIALNPDYAEAFNNRGCVLLEMHRLDEALASCDKAIALNPVYAHAFNNRGRVLLEMHRVAEGAASYRNETPGPDDELRLLEEALTNFDKAIVLKPDYAEAFNNRGTVLLELKRLDETLASHDKAIALRPDYADAFDRRSGVLFEMERFDKALASCDSAIALRPDHARCSNNRGVILTELMRLDEALSSYDKAIALKPDFAAALNSRGMLSLLMGRYREGWADFEWRGKASRQWKPPAINAPHWQGENLAGRHIVVYAEMHFGDVIHFARYVPLLSRRGAKVTFIVPATLARLFRTFEPHIEIACSDAGLSPVDFQCALMSLPLRFGTESTSIPGQTPYLRAETDLVARWKNKIGDKGFKIGIAWQGKAQRTADRRRFTLTHIIPLSRVSSVRLISLQKNAGVEQLEGIPPDTRVETLGDFDDGPDAFIDTAAVMETLDLIITSDTSIAHLAGALGRPTWIALKYVPDWRWSLDRDDSPWYPNARLFRQDANRDWTSVFSKIEQELRALLDAAPGYRRV
jgi:tetratricopeptide (TPR) repeat protein